MSRTDQPNTSDSLTTPAPTTPPKEGENEGPYRFRHWSITPVCHSLIDRMSGSFDSPLPDDELQVEGTWLQWRLDNWHGPEKGPWVPFDNAVKELIQVTLTYVQKEIADRAVKPKDPEWRKTPDFKFITAHHWQTKDADRESFWLVRGPKSDLLAPSAKGVIRVTSGDMGTTILTPESGTPGITGVSPYFLWDEWCPCLSIMRDYQPAPWPKMG